MGKVLVVQSAAGYSKEAEVTKNAFLTYVADVFGHEHCKLEFLPQDCYGVVYDIYTGDVTFWWEDNARSMLLTAMNNVDVVIVTSGSYSWRNDNIVRTAVEHTETIVLEYDNVKKTLTTIYDPSKH